MPETTVVSPLRHTTRLQERSYGLRTCLAFIYMPSRHGQCELLQDNVPKVSDVVDSGILLFVPCTGHSVAILLALAHFTSLSRNTAAPLSTDNDHCAVDDSNVALFALCMKTQYINMIAGTGPACPVTTTAQPGNNTG